MEAPSFAGKRCHLNRAIRDPRSGAMHFHEDPLILREAQQMGRAMFLVRFDNNDESYVFPEEVEIDE